MEFLEDAAHNGIDYPAKRDRDVPAQRQSPRLQHRFPRLSLLELGDAVEAPDT